MLARPHRCRCRTCEECGWRYGLKVRRRLLGKAGEFRQPALFTLTVKPSRFGDDPAKAFIEITDKRYVARLLKDLGVKRWVCVLELQKSGFPHWHVLIDLADLPGCFLDLKRAWKLWGCEKDKWRVGSVDLGKARMRDGTHAIRYITKYLVKYPEEGFPDWVLDLRRRIRWVSASKSVGPVVSDREATEADVAKHPERFAEEAVDSLPIEHRPLRLRMFKCKKNVEFFREFIDQRTGEATFRYVGAIEGDMWRRALRGGHVPVHTVDDDGTVWVMDQHRDFRKQLEIICGKGLIPGSIPEHEREYLKLMGEIEERERE